MIYPALTYTAIFLMLAVISPAPIIALMEVMVGLLAMIIAIGIES